MIDNVYVCTHPHIVGGTEADAYAIVTIRGKDWWLCVNDDGTPFFLPYGESNDER